MSQRVSRANLENEASHLEILLRDSAQRNHINPINVSLTMGSPSKGNSYFVSFYNNHRLIIGTTAREALATLQAMTYILRWEQSR